MSEVIQERFYIRCNLGHVNFIAYSYQKVTCCSWCFYKVIARFISLNFILFCHNKASNIKTSV